MISKWNVLILKSNVVMGCTFHSVGFYPSDSQSDYIYNILAQLSIVRALGGIGGCPKVCLFIIWPNDLHNMCNILGIIVRKYSKGPSHVHHRWTKSIESGKTNNHEIQDSLESQKVNHHLNKNHNKQFTLGIFLKLQITSRVYTI